MSYDLTGAAMVALARSGVEAAQRAAYSDFRKNFRTVAGFASYYGLSPSSADAYLTWWRDVYEAHCTALAAIEAAEAADLHLHLTHE